MTRICPACPATLPDLTHDGDCAWYREHNTPEAKARFLTELNAHAPCAEHPECSVCQRNYRLCSAHLHQVGAE